MDKFEQYIRKIRKDLDIYEVSSDSWKRIEKKITKKKSLKWQLLSAAAMILVILGTATILFKPSLKPGRHPYEPVNSETSNITDPLLSETEIYYNNLVSSLYSKAAPILITNPEIERELSDDLSKLDSICSEIKRDFKDNIANKEVVEALIQNYRIKIRLLEDILNSFKEEEDNTGKNNRYEL